MILGGGKQAADTQSVTHASASQDSSDASRNPLPTISLPKGGGAIRGIGEKFAANPVTGTGSMTVPITTSPGRSGFGPQLSLSYDSGSGNGPFGFGWTLSLPEIRRKTDKGLPQYHDAEESDVYILSGAEDLVPEFKKDASGKWIIQDGKYVIFDELHTINDVTYRVRRYRPRIEGLFARIERWTNQTNGEVYWRSITRDNITTLYGKDNTSRIFDPADLDLEHPKRIFSWLICESYDDKGNAIIYQYATENDENIDRTQANERNRVRTANRYLKRIKYGNRVSRLIQPDLTQAQWMFEVVFDYDEGHYEVLDLDPNRPEIDQHRFVRASASPERSWESQERHWPIRPDPFSSYRAGFEVRTYRRCHRVLMFHRFAELGSEPYLVRSTEFEYSDLNYSQPTTIEAELAHQGSTRFASFLRAVTQSGFVCDDTKAELERNDIKYLTYLKKSLPPLEFEYSKGRIQDTIHELDASSLENLPYGLDGATYQWVDLDGEGICSILTEQANTWFYKPNLGAGQFGPLEVVAAKPSLAALSSGRQQLLDLAGDGQLDLVEFGGSTPGFYERTHDQRWEPFTTFPSLPSISWDDPNLRFVDLNGDGHADVLITENDIFTWYPSLAEEGFGPAQYVRKPLDEETGPRLVFADGTQSIYLADMAGDGLTDLVRIRNGEVCYWPNLGYGWFGAKVTMDNTPWFDNPDQFSQQRIRLADIDGSGTNDMIYLGRDGVRLYFNQSGNRWSEPRHLSQFPRIDHLSSVMTADLLGNGTACLVWSSPLPGDTQRPMRYIDLMSGQKPHLLIKVRNNLGAETRVQYTPSTRFYLADKLAGKPWVTRLPFPVYVVERVDTHDHISHNHFVTRYAYHHGYFDGVEREFRGFGMVEQWDTEAFAAFTEDGTLPEATNLDAAFHVPPVLTRTWFHTGASLEREQISRQFEDEYYREPGLSDQEFRDLLLPDTILPTGLMLEEECEACRALKGMMLRQESYALDDTDKAEYPYTVTEQNFTIERLQSKGDNRHAVFFTHAREAISYHYERNPSDPRIAHALTLEVDPYGNVLKDVTIGYGRRTASTDPALTADDKAKQTRLLITYTDSSFTNAIDDVILYPDDYRTPLLAETRTYELTGFKPEKNAVRFSFDEWSRNRFALLASAAAIPYEQSADDNTQQKRLIEHVRTLYRKDDLTALLPLGELEPLALLGESYQLAFTPGLLAQVFQHKQTGQPDEDLLPKPTPLLEGQGDDQGGYIALDGNWWIPSGRAFFDPNADISNPALTSALELSTARQHFYLPRKIADPFGHSTMVIYDGPTDPNAPRYDLLVTSTSDALSNTVTATNDYRVLQPRLVADSNRNRTAATFDALGMVVATAVMGKQGENKGDNLVNFEADLTQTQVDTFHDALDPHALAVTLLKDASTRIIYDLHRFSLSQQAHPTDSTQWEPPYMATLARETHVSDPLPPQGLKIQISFSYSDGFGREIQKKIQAEPGEVEVEDAVGKVTLVDTMPNSRWVGSGWTIFNNKGKPVRQYEPFFSTHHQFQFGKKVGASSILFYDPVERVVATLHPNHIWEKVVFDPWQQETWDVNDTIKLDPRTDTNISGYVAEYFKQVAPHPNDWKTWLQQRSVDPLAPPPDTPGLAPEKKAAVRTLPHADTPTVAHFDTLGRPFLTLAHNGFKADGTPIQFPTRVKLDIEGNQREVIDAKDRIVMHYDYDLLSNCIHQASMEAGERWILNDVMGKPIRTWDSRKFMRRMTYDVLRRPIGLFVTEDGLERLAERTVYGESQGDANNHRTRVYQIFDGAGVVTNESYDFKGNLLQSKRELLHNYQQAVDWRQNPIVNDGTFITRTEYDALNRPLAITTPDDSVYHPTFNEANLLNKVEVNLRGSGKASPFVANIDYNAKGQRTSIRYANGAETTYEYDDQTFRLIHLKTTRPAGLNGLASQLFTDPTIIQDLHYTYDPVGNITNIADNAILTIQYNNEQVEPEANYIYDAIYRLIFAHSREHIGQTAFGFNPPDGNYRDYPFVGLSAGPNDPKAVRNYSQTYDYDEVGNIKSIRHSAVNGSWTRTYTYSEPSLLEADKNNNRLMRTQVGNGPNFTESCGYTDAQGNDVHGCITSINNMQMGWDFKDQLQTVNLGGGGKAYYVYDASGQRVRKVINRQNGTRQKERIYLGGFEIYREYNGAGDTKPKLERETLHIMDDKQRIALVETQTIENGNLVNDPVPLQRYQFGDHLGSASVELAEGGVLISYEEYHPYGTTAFQAGRSVTEMSLKRYRYIGKERDEESGLYYYEARYYAPWLGRWVSCDPTGIAAGLNVYGYSRQSPLRFVDREGLAEDDATEVSSKQVNQVSQQQSGLSNRTESASEMARRTRYLPSSSDPFLSPMTHEEFVYQHNLLIGEALEAGFIQPGFSIWEDKELETGTFSKGKYYPDYETVYKNGMRVKSARIEAEYEFREGYWYQVAGKPEAQLWGKEAATEAQKENRRLNQNGPVASANIDDMLRSDYIFNFDRSTGESPRVGAQPQNIVERIYQRLTAKAPGPKVGVIDLKGPDFIELSPQAKAGPKTRAPDEPSRVLVDILPPRQIGTVVEPAPFGRGLGFGFSAQMSGREVYGAAGLSPYTNYSFYLSNGVNTGTDREGAMIRGLLGIAF